MRVDEDGGRLERLFKKSGLRLTMLREHIFNTLAHTQEALSMQDLEDLLETVDKSTISRSLHLLTEVGAVHRIDDGSGINKYAVTTTEAGEETATNHAHFYCRKCGRTFCFDRIKIPSVCVPEGFVPEGYSMVIKGLCPDCK